ncbi:MAG: hypothetical protein H0W75_00770 [Chitinophagaceae bacterium]|nr:hypothetical protein [Chitinophagaceae bacterium]
MKKIASVLALVAAFNFGFAQTGSFKEITFGGVTRTTWPLEAEALNTTITGLRSTTTPSASLRYYTTNAGQEGFWFYDASDVTSKDNIGTVLVSTNGKRFKRIFTGAVLAQWWGLNGDGITDNSAKILAAAAAAYHGSYGVRKLVMPSGTFAIRADVLFKGYGAFAFEGNYQQTTTLKLFNGAKIGLDSAGGFNRIAHFEITTGDKLSDYGLYIKNNTIGSFEDIQVRGYYLKCGIAVLDNSFSSMFTNIITNVITAGDGMWLIGDNLNSIKFYNCFFLSTLKGYGLRVGGHVNQVSFIHPQFEANSLGDVLFYSSQTIATVVTDMNFQNIYSESNGKVFSVLQQDKGILTVQNLNITHGFANLFNAIPYFADFSGIIPSRGSVNFTITDVTVEGITIAVVKGDANVSGFINMFPPRKRGTGILFPILDNATKAASHIIYSNKTFFGSTLGYNVPTLLAGITRTKFNSLPPTAGVFAFDTIFNKIVYKNGTTTKVLIDSASAAALYIPLTSNVAHLSGAESFTGSKTFTVAPVVNIPSVLPVLQTFSNTAGTQRIYQDGAGGGIFTPSLSGWYTRENTGQTSYLASGKTKLDISGTGHLTLYEQLTLGPAFTPASSKDATHPVKTLTADDNYLWYRTSTGTWKKIAWSDF